MTVEVDLHVHTLVSEDGELTPADLFEAARALDLRALAFCDHDAVDAVDEGLVLSTQTGIAFAPAVELSTRMDDYDLHVLGYFVDHRAEPLQSLLKRNFELRVEAASRRVTRLRELGFVLSLDEVMEEAAGRGPTTRAVVAALSRHEMNRAREDFRRYLEGDRADSPVYNFYRDWFVAGRPAHVAQGLADTAEALARVHASGGVAVLAHPGRTPVELVDRLLDAGLDGLEAWCSTHTPPQSAQFADYAKRHGLLLTAGSDYHGPTVKPDVKLGGLERGEFAMFEALRERAAS